MQSNGNKYSGRQEGGEERGFSRMNQSQTPSKRDKYDSYTPRKRYIKEQEQYDWYRNLQIQPVEPFPQRLPSHAHTSKPPNPSLRNNSSHKKQPHPPTPTPHYHIHDLYPSSFEKIHPSEGPVPLREATAQLNCATSIRKTKLKNYFQNKEICKKITFTESENSDSSNTVLTNPKKDYRENKQRFLDIENHFCLTPRRAARAEQHASTVNNKITIIQNKIAKLERMTPKKSAPKPAQHPQAIPEFWSCSQGEREESKIESSRVSVSSSSKENEIMSRVSLGRLVEEEECESEMEVIQDLSYKISSKLRSIIRNFG